MSISTTYSYPVPLSAATKEPIVSSGTSDIQSIKAAYQALFGDTGVHTRILNGLFEQLKNILKEGSNTKQGQDKLKNIQNTFNSTDDLNAIVEALETKITWDFKNTDNNKLCKEGIHAYIFYLKDVVADLKQMSTYVSAAQELLEKLDNANSDNAHVIFDKLSTYDQFCEEIVQGFTEHFDTKNGEYVISTAKSTECLDTKGLKAATVMEMSDLWDKSNLDDFRSSADVQVFNQLRKLEKLKYIRMYYNIILGNTGLQTVFPDDLSTGYPCVPNDSSSESATSEVQEMGGLEMFYIGYLISRDGPINALSSFLEVKTQALRQNIALMMEKVGACNRYLSFINRGLDLLNTSQSGGNSAIPPGAYVALTFFCGGTMRGLKTIKHPDGGEAQYFVFSTDEYDSNGYSLSGSKKSGNGRYLLIKSDDSTLDNFLGGSTGYATDWWRKDNQYTWDIEKYNEKLSDKEGTSLGVQFTVDGMDNVSFYKGFARSYFNASPKDNTVDLRPTASYNGTNTNKNGEYIVAVPSSVDVAKSWLPKQLAVDKVLPSSAQRYNSNWFEKIDATVLNSWTTAFTNKSQYINTYIETINNDVSTMRTKIDTFDSASSTFRNRAYDTYSSIVSRIS